jgi:hypothetical protein
VRGPTGFRNALGALLALGLLGAVPVDAAQAPAGVDPEVAKGIALVDEGDYDTAIVTLDGAARRLAVDGTKVKDLSQAYLYLGIAYVGKGHEAAAKAKFREAVSRIRDLTLSADRYPPKVIDLFEAAKEEARRDGTGPSSAGRTPAPAEMEERGGGGKKVLLIGGGAAVAGGAAFLLLKSDEGGGGCEQFFAGPEGLLNASQRQFALTTPPRGAGRWKADVMYTVSGGSEAVFVFAVNATNDQPVNGQARQVTPVNTVLEWDGSPNTPYRVGVNLQGGGSATYVLNIEGPCL